MAHRNRKRKRRALAHLTLHPDPSAMQLDELPRQGQAEPGALDFLGRRPDLLELLENRFLILRCDPDPRIGHRDFDTPIYWHCSHVDASPFRCELDRVREQVEEHLADLPLVALDVPEPI